MKMPGDEVTKENDGGRLERDAFSCIFNFFFLI
jgi:hypothetical protein